MGDLLYKQVNKKLLAKKQVKGQCLSVKTSISRICLLSKVKNAGIQVKGTFPFLLEHLQLFQQTSSFTIFLWLIFSFQVWQIL